MTPNAMYLIAKGTIITQQRQRRVIVHEGRITLLKELEATHRNPRRDLAKLSGKIEATTAPRTSSAWYGPVHRFANLKGT